MRVQLFNPPVWQYQHVNYRMNPPLSLPMLVAVMRERGWTAEGVDLEALAVHPDTLQAKFENSRGCWPDIIGFTCTTPALRGVRESITAVRNAGYDGPIAVGGVHATIRPKECIEAGATLVVRGECEGNVCDIFESHVRQWAVDMTAEVMEGVAADVSTLPIPAWSYCHPKPNAYMGNAPHFEKPEAISMWTRGCPYQCYFCGNSIFSPTKKRVLPFETIRADLAQLKNYGTKTLFVYDDELVGVKLPGGWFGDLADNIQEFGYGFKTQGRCSRKWVTRDALENLKRAGCKAIMWGCESFSPKILAGLGKGTTVEDNWHTLRLSAEVGIRNWVFSMIGNLEESDEELAQTAEALGQAYREGIVQYRQTTVVTALPGTKLYDIQKRDGWYHQPPEGGPQMGQVYHDTPWLKSERIHYWLQKFAEVCPAGCE